MAPRLVSVIEAADMLGLAPQTLRHQIRKGKMAAVKVGPRTWYITTGEVERYRHDHRKDAA